MNRNSRPLVDIRTLGVALRRTRRAPGFTASVVVILALGIGANAVMFGVVDRLLLSPPQHIVDADEVRVLHVRRASPATGAIRFVSALSYPDYQDFQAVDAFADVAVYRPPWEETVGRGEAARRAQVAAASASLFPLLGVKPALGQFFPLEEDGLAANPIAILAHEYWDRRYGRDPGVLGRVIDVGTRSLTVIGIAPAGFTGAALAPVDIWIPISESVPDISSLTGRRLAVLQPVVRLAPGAAVEAAEAEATAMHRGGRAELIAAERYDAEAEVVLSPLIAAWGPNPTSEAQVARWLAGVSLIVLIIACFNVANLLLARAIRTRREMAVRLALGASRRDLIGEIVSESLVLATMGAGAALLVARILGDAVHRTLLPNVVFSAGSVGGRLLGFTLVAALVTAFVTGLIPAAQANKAALSGALRAGGGGVAPGRSRIRMVLIVGQVALSVVLLVGAGLFVVSLRSAQERDLGYDSRNIVVAELEFNGTIQPMERRAVYERALAGVRRLPGVHSAGLTRVVPFNSIQILRYRVPGLDSVRSGTLMNKVSSGYFGALGLTILQGRGFEPPDDPDEAQPVAVVNQNMAAALWPGGDALGACMVIAAEDGPCTEVVGVVENHVPAGFTEENPYLMYLLNQGHPASRSPLETLMVGTTGDAELWVDLVRDELRTASTQVRYVHAVPLRDYIEPGMRSWRLGASMFTAFGVLALIVAGWGLYSVLAFDVALRQRELGVRSALGASVTSLVRLVLRQAMLFVFAGVGIGLFASWAASRFVGPLLFQVSATDPPIYGLVAVTLVLVAALAGSLPAWRATRVDPREALQAD